jgi:hypothetical protein
MPEELGHKTQSAEVAEAARVALFVMQGIQQDTALELNGFVFPPSAERIDAHAALQVLMSRPKPLRCSCRVENGNLAISCENLIEAELPGRLPELQNRWWESVRLRGLSDIVGAETLVRSIDTIRILLRSRDDSYITTAAGLNRFDRDYSIAHTSAIERPAEAERGAGISAVYGIWPSVAWVLKGPHLKLEGR